ncbi:hypothetical protein MLD38_023179 [Melastoma candidum]|uniref:Uncharacterized protein n=1 Tax=Melastoma candidum TaxID=119954 RepID=A0ACB9QLU6_9MYRT|nr:hypothetical protein MLD38_023179 [Melastoma candidum]
MESSSETVDDKVFPNGDVYRGGVQGALLHGKGTYRWGDGTVYEGDWEEGTLTGKGKIIWPSGARYEGDIAGGYLHGCGTFTGTDGSVYSGAWRMNVQHGVGKKEYSNSDTYDGMWKEGIHEGCGRYTWSSGNTYVGNWKAGKMSGRGVMKWENGDLYNGFWLDGLRHGSGIYRFADGGYYFGSWTKSLKDGKGTYYPAGRRRLSARNWSALGPKDVVENLFSGRSSVSLEELSPLRNGGEHSLSERLLVGGMPRYSGRISHRASSLDERWNMVDYDNEIGSFDSSFGMPHDSSNKKHEMMEEDSIVYEREYVQGVLTKERARNYKELLQKNKPKNKFARKDSRQKPGENISSGHRSDYLMLNLQLGIRYTVGKITPVPRREVRSSDFGEQARIRMYFPSQGSQFTPPHYSIDFYWKDYCPMVFRNLREMFKLDAAEYMMSICGDDGLRQMNSPGKSGSIFYLSLDGRFVIKTLKKSELMVLTKMLPDYYRHVGDHENTLITKFFGLHRIKLKGGKKVRFVVMGNMFCTELRIHRRYDLKGSTVGRCTDIDKITEDTTLKDLDLSYVFHMDKLLRESFLKQVLLDCKFLESQNIIDYSLLLGLHFRAPEHLKALLDRADSTRGPESYFSANAGSLEGDLFPSEGLILVTHEPSSVNTAPGPHIRGSTLRAYSVGDEEVDLLLPGTARLRVQLGVNMPAKASRKLVDEAIDTGEVELFEVYDVVLYMGIIDILQNYNLRKKVEHAYKSLKFDPGLISATDPKLYSTRFFSFLERVFPASPTE